MRLAGTCALAPWLFYDSISVAELHSPDGNLVGVVMAINVGAG